MLDEIRNNEYSYDYFESAWRDFNNEFNRVPDINEKDFKWLIDRTGKYYVKAMVAPAKKK